MVYVGVFQKLCITKDAPHVAAVRCKILASEPTRASGCVSLLGPMGQDDSDSDLDLERPAKGSKPVESRSVPAEKGGQSGHDAKSKKRKEERPVSDESDLDLERGKVKSKRSKRDDDDLLIDRSRPKISDMKKTKSKKAKARDLDSEGSDLNLQRPSKKEKGKVEKDVKGKDGKEAPKAKEVPKSKEVQDSDSDIPVRRNGASNFDRVEPSRSRDAPFDGKGDGKGFGKGKDGKGKGGKGKGKDEANDQPKEEPNFEPSGLLALEDNAKNGIPLKFTVPAEARRPATKWRLYVFSKENEKRNEGPKIIQIHKNVGYLFGKDRRIVDVPTDHPTCSKQHAVLHYRVTTGGVVKPYIMDLESVNGTWVNGEKIQAARYVELREKDVLKFGMSSREFVLLHGGSANHVAIDAKDLKSDSE